MSKHFKAIAAMAQNRVIGMGNKIPWHLPEDFKWFKRTTVGNVIILGRKTFESLGRPLPNRKNLILTRHPRRLIKQHPEVFGTYKEWRGGERVGKTLKKPYQFEFRFTKLDENDLTEILIFNSLAKLTPEDFQTDTFICGGAEIYAQMLPRCSDLYLTLVKREVEGDAFFPLFEDKFDLVDTLRDEPEFKILHYRHRSLFNLAS